MDATNKEIADFYGCSADLIEKSYSEFTTKGRGVKKLRLRQIQWKVLRMAMRLWLSG